MEENFNQKIENYHIIINDSDNKEIEKNYDK